VAGVAINTASVILNNRPNCWAAEDTRKRVLAAAEQLAYRPNRMALAVKRGRFDTIGLIVPDLNNPFFMSLADQIEQAAEAHGCDLLVEHSRVDLQREVQCLESILDRQVDGIIACLMDPPMQSDVLKKQIKFGVPIVVAGPQGQKPLPVDLVSVDITSSLRRALLYLKRLGHTRVAFIRALAENQGDNLRQQLFFQVAREPELGFAELDLSAESSDHSLAGARAAFQRLMTKTRDKRPTAVVGLNDLCALGAMRGAQEFGLRIPQDLSIIGVDNIAFCEYTSPSLTTIAQPIREIAQETVRMLLQRINGQGAPEPQVKQLTSKLIRRESSGYAPKD
jgi:DNA-binding LacI/PurR family transcriptional regulator